MRFTLGDETVEDADGDGFSFTRSFSQNGTFTVSATAFDAAGLSTSASKSITVNVPAAISTGSAQVGFSGLPLNAGIALVLTNAANERITIPTGGLVSGLPAGTYTLSAPDVQSGDMTYRAAPVQFQVVNGQTTNATLSFAAIDGKIHLTLEAGSVTPSVSITGPDGFAHTLTAGGFSSLPYLKPGQYTISAAAATDGTYQYAASVTPASLDLQAGQVGVVNVAYQAVTGTLSVSLMGTPEGRSFTLNGPDGFSASVQHGSALKDLKGGVYTLEGASFTDGGWTYTPDTSTVTVVSGQPASLSVTFTRQDVQAPQHVTLQAPAKVSAAGDATFTVSASDNDRVATFKLYEGTTLLGTQSAQDGAASFTVSYASADQGTHIYHVVAVDAAGNEAGSAESTVLVDFNGDPVVVGTIADQTVLRNQTIQVELAGAFSDPNGDALTYSVTPASFQGATLSVSGSILSITKANNNSSGEVTVTVTATDPSGKSASTTCQLTVIR